MEVRSEREGETTHCAPNQIEIRDKTVYPGQMDYLLDYHIALVLPCAIQKYSGCTLF